MFSLNRSAQIIQQRLNRLLKVREQKSIVADDKDIEFLINPSELALRPVIRGGVMLAVLLAGFWWLNRPTEISQIETLNSQINTVQESQGTLGEVVVHVTGEVNKPGLVKLPSGSRVMDAINAAGGFSSAQSAGNLNLAAHLEDGQLIYVGQESVIPDDPRLNLNTATITQLEDLPGVGPVMAGRIIEWRSKHNRFSTIEELQEIEGIGPKLFSRLRELVRV